MFLFVVFEPFVQFVVKSLKLFPEAGDGRAAVGTGAGFGDGILEHGKAAAANQQATALWTEGIFQRADPSRQVPGVDVTQPGFLPDLGRALQDGRRGGRPVGHFVIRMESRHMPGDVG